MIVWYADEGKDTGRGLWGGVAAAVDLEIRETGLSSTGLPGLGGTKKQEFFFTSASRSLLSFSDPCLRVSMLKHIKIQTSRLTSQHRYLQQQAKTR